MQTKKAITVTVFVIVIAMAAMTAAIVWLSANLPSGRALLYETGADYADGPQPGEHEHPGQNDAGDGNDEPRGNDDTGSASGYVYEEHPEYPPSENPPEEYPPYEHLEYPPDEYPSHDSHFTPIFTAEPLPEHIIDLITGVTFHDTTPFGYDFLAYLTVTHVNFYGESVLGHLIVAADIAYEVLDIFREMYYGEFPIHSIILIDYFGASDYLSMAANNSHAFNFRYIAGTNTVSRHGFGVAIDINPVQNPYIRGGTIWPAAGAAYLDRSYVRPGMIVPGNVAYNAFMSRGWTWGGYWTSLRDYHHFELRR